MKKYIAVLPGDGIGPEITDAAVHVLKKIAEVYNHEFEFEKELIGAVAIEETGDPYPAATAELCKKSDSVLLGAVGDPKYDNDPSAKVRPEQGLLRMRADLGLFANIRPIKTYKALFAKSPLKEDLLIDVDFVIVRELTGGIYFGKRGRDGNKAYDTAEYSKEEIVRVATSAFDIARARGGKLTLVDKANVLDTSRLWREVVQEMASGEYKDIEVEYMFVDNCAQQIIKRPADFNVVLTENMFGDILSDEAAVIVGSLGMLPSASLGEKYSLFEPIHGSFPRAAGQNTANPIGTIMSAAMLLGTQGLEAESHALNAAVQETIDAGIGTRDIFPNNPTPTSVVAEEIASRIVAAA